MISVLLLALTSAPTFELEWRAPPSCAPRPDVQAITGGAAGRARVELRETDDAWEVTVIFLKPYEGLRQVTAGSCEEAGRVAALLVQLGSRGALGEALVEPSAPPMPEPAPPLPPTSPAQLSLHAGAALDVGTSNAVDPRLAVSANLIVGAFRVALDGRVGFAVEVPGTAARVERTGEGQVAACAHFAWRSISGGPCAAVALSSWRVVHGGRAGQTLLVAAGPQLRAELHLVAGLELGALAGLRFNLRRPAPFDELGTIFSTPLLAGDLQLTLGWRF